jgi:elongation factor G
MKPRRIRSEVPIHSIPPANAVESGDLRTVAIVGHRSAGKTTLAEMLLEAGRVVRERGTIDEGTTLLDASPESRRNRLTLDLATAWFEWRADIPSEGPTDHPGRDAGPGDGARVIQVLDTPGTDALSAIRDMGLTAAEAALVAIDAGAGVEVGTDDAVAAASALGLPVIGVITKADRSVPDLPGIARALSLATGARAVPVHLPFLDEHGRLIGLIDVLADRALRFADDRSGGRSPEPVPEALAAQVAAAREQVVDAVAMTDDQLLEEYLEYLALPAPKVEAALARAILRRRIVPILLTSALDRVGARELLDRLVSWVPPFGAVPRTLRAHDGERIPLQGFSHPDAGGAEGSFVAQVLSEHLDPARGERWHLMRILAGAPPRGDWIDGRSGRAHKVRKLYRMRGQRRSGPPPGVPGLIVATYDPLPVPAGTTFTAGERVEVVLPTPRPPMMALTVRPADPADERAVAEALQAAIRGDRGLALLADTNTGARLLAGADESHLRLTIERLVAWTGAQVVAELPPVGYVEMPASQVRGVEGIHVEKDGDGLVEAFGKCEITLVPTDPGNAAHFVDALGEIEDDLPIRYRGAIDEGAREAMRHGPTAGYPVVGAQLQLTGGAYDILQSTDDHFRLAGERAARTALERAGTRVLEPWIEIEVHAPQQAVGDLISDISAHRGRILGMEVEGPIALLVALCPYRELRTFASRLRALTHGRGRYRTQKTRYEVLPDHLLSEAIAASPHRVANGPGFHRQTPTSPPVVAVAGRAVGR